MLMSVFFLLITLIIYGCIPTLQNLNGKCLLCYLATLAFGYTLLSGVQLNSSNYMQPLLCDSVGYLVYFTLFSAFLWLSVINFDLWLNFQCVLVLLLFCSIEKSIDRPKSKFFFIDTDL